MPFDDPAHVAALRRGDHAAFARLVREHGPALRRVAAEHVASPTVQDEVVQDTWLAAWEGLGRFEGRAPVRTWLLSIVRNQAITRGVREARTRPGIDLAAPAIGPSPPDHLLAHELRGRLGAAVGRLPARRREVFVLRDVQGRSAAEVCELLDLSPGNQRVLLHRAHRQLRALLRDDA